MDDVISGPPNLIRLVHKHRKKPVVVRLLSNEEQDTSNSNSPTINPPGLALEPATVVAVDIGKARFVCKEKASEILRSEVWCKAVKETLVSDGQDLMTMKLNQMLIHFKNFYCRGLPPTCVGVFQTPRGDGRLGSLTSKPLTRLVLQL